MTERIFSLSELKKYNGEDLDEVLIAFNGIVYNVSDCPKWMHGMHENIHFPGQDLSDEIAEAPHGSEVFKRPCVKIAGRLQAHA